jgi:hypothetical protein
VTNAERSWQIGGGGKRLYGRGEKSSEVGGRRRVCRRERRGVKILHGCHVAVAMRDWDGRMKGAKWQLQ